MKINIGIGLDNIIFGMSQDDVKSIIGKPDKITEAEEFDNIIYYYNKLLIKTKFDKDEDYRLYSIDVYNPEALIFNQKMIYKDKREVLDILNLNGYKQLSYDDYGSFDTVFCEEIWSTFMFEFDRLISIEFSPLFKDNDIIIWPPLG